MRVLRRRLLWFLGCGAALARAALSAATLAGRWGCDQFRWKSCIGEAVDEPGIDREASPIDDRRLRRNRNVRTHCLDESIADHHRAAHDHRSGDWIDFRILDRVDGPRGRNRPRRRDQDQEKSVAEPPLHHSSEASLPEYAPLEICGSIINSVNDNLVLTACHLTDESLIFENFFIGGTVGQVVPQLLELVWQRQFMRPSESRVRRVRLTGEI